MNNIIFTEFQVAMLICLIGILFGIGWGLGKEAVIIVRNKIRKPVTVRFTHDDGTVSEIKLSHEETRGYKKVRALWRDED